VPYLGSGEGKFQSSTDYREKTSVHHQGQTSAAYNSGTASSLFLGASLLSSIELLEDFREIVDLLPYSFPSSMASEPSEWPEHQTTAGRRIDTPPRSIFDDYQSAYQSILSPCRTFTGNSKAVDMSDTPDALPELLIPSNPFTDLSPSRNHTHIPPCGTGHGSNAATRDGPESELPSSLKLKRKTNFSRPLSISPASDQALRPGNAVVNDHVSIFNVGSPRRPSQDRSPNTNQPNLHGARGRVEKSSAIGRVVKRRGDDSDPDGNGTKVDRIVEAPSPFDIVGCGKGTHGCHSAKQKSSPAGQAPSIPLPPDPSYVAATDLIGETLSEASLYENTEKLLNLTKSSRTDVLAGQTGSGSPFQLADGLQDRLHRDFSRMGNRGKTSIRDLSAKELVQLRKPSQGHQLDVASKVGDVSDDDKAYGDPYLPTNTVYPPPKRQPVALDNLVKADARRAGIRSEYLTNQSPEKSTGPVEPNDDIDKESERGEGAVCNPQVDSVLDFGGLQSSSSREASLEVSLRDGRFRQELYLDSSSLASLTGRENADAARLSALAGGEKSIRSPDEDEDEKDDLVTEEDENEGGEWETMGESGMRSRLGTQASFGRDTSGSSLANVSSNESAEDDRSAPSPWDPLMTYPAMITPPGKAVVHDRSGYIPGVKEPATVPRYAPLGADRNLEMKLKKTSSSTPVLSFSATPRYQGRRENSPTYRHPEPLCWEHQNPFSSSPPPVVVQSPGRPSFELSKLTRKRKPKDKCHAICAGSSHSLHQQIHKPTETHLKNPLTNQDTSSDKSVDGSYSTIYPTHLVEDGSSLVNLNSPHTPKSMKSFTRGSIKGTKTHFARGPSCMGFCIGFGI
jgi:hypothetical protein